MPQEALYDMKIHVLHLELTSHLLPLTRMAGYAFFLFRKVDKVILIHFGGLSFCSVEPCLVTLYLTIFCCQNQSSRTFWIVGITWISIPKGYDTGVSRGSVGCPLIDAFRLRSRGFVGFCRITPVQNEASMRHMLM